MNANYALIDHTSKQVVKLTNQESINDAVWELGCTPSASTSRPYDPNRGPTRSVILQGGLELREVPFGKWTAKSATAFIFPSVPE